MESFEQRLITLFERIHPLDRVARAGYVMRGVTEPESVSAHSHFLSVLTLLFVEEHDGAYDKTKALTMALVLDLAEAELMDIPMPSADAYLREAKDKAEQSILESMFEGFPAKYADAHRELAEAETPEARLVRGLDKAQMMIKILMYEREGRGRLQAFWFNPKNFNDYGIDAVSSLFDAICAEAGHPRPR